MSKKPEQMIMNQVGRKGFYLAKFEPCQECEGTGHRRELMGASSSVYVYMRNQPCPVCLGSGDHMSYVPLLEWVNGQEAKLKPASPAGLGHRSAGQVVADGLRELIGADEG